MKQITINWQDLIINLCKVCGSQVTVSNLTEIPSSSLSSLKDGSVQEPVHSRGVRLLELAKRVGVKM